MVRIFSIISRDLSEDFFFTETRIGNWEKDFLGDKPCFAFFLFLQSVSLLQKEDWMKNFKSGTGLVRSSYLSCWIKLCVWQKAGTCLQLKTWINPRCVSIDRHWRGKAGIPPWRKRRGLTCCTFCDRAVAAGTNDKCQPHNAILMTRSEWNENLKLLTEF